MPASQPRQGQLHLHAPLVAHQLVPFVDDDRVHTGQPLARIGPREQQAQRLGRGDQGLGQAAVLTGPLGSRRVAGAQAHTPTRGQVR